MSVDLSYVAAVLKFSAVPGAYIELLQQDRRVALEAWLYNKIRPTIKLFIISTLALWSTLVVFSNFGPFVALFVLAFGGGFLYWWLVAKISDWLDLPDSVQVMLMLGPAVAGLLSLLLGFAPQAWVAYIPAPFELFSSWANQHPRLGYLVPDYSSIVFMENYLESIKFVQEWLWGWLSWLYFLLFFGAKGFLFLLVIGIQVVFLLAMAMGLIACLMSIGHLFARFSEAVKTSLNLEAEGRLPVGAVALWAIGETLSFGLETLKLF